MPFVKDPKNLKSYPNKINYRCKLYRKNNHKLDGFCCHSIVKRIVNKENITYEMIRDHNEECKKFNIIHKNYEDNTIHNYEEFVKQCRTFMDSSEFYNKKEFRVKLLDIYNKEKYNFKLKENTIDNIINNWKSNSIKFSKYNALENYKYEENEIILWEHRTPIIYLPHKKKAIYSKYFICSHDQMISRSRIGHHFFIDGTFHHPKNFQQLLIILFKDIIINEYIPCFFILMSQKNQQLYNLALQSVKTILTQYDIYTLKIETITTDGEGALINALNNNFSGYQRVSCWFHLKQDIIKNAKFYGLFRSYKS